MRIDLDVVFSLKFDPNDTFRGPNRTAPYGGSTITSESGITSVKRGPSFRSGNLQVSLNGGNVLQGTWVKSPSLGC